MTKSAYEQMIKENIEWLQKMPRTLEREHIILICKESIRHEYSEYIPSPNEEIKCLRDDVVDLRETLNKISLMVEHDSEIYTIAQQAVGAVSDVKGGCPHGNSRTSCKDCPEIG